MNAQTHRWISRKNTEELYLHVCVLYLRLRIDVGIVGNQLLHHLCLPSKGSYVEGCVSFLFSNGKKYTIFNVQSYVYVDGVQGEVKRRQREGVLKTTGS